MIRRRIDVGDKFRRQAYPTNPALQPTDYTAYSQGAKKIGLISQVGLMRRRVDAAVFKTRIAASSTTKGGSSPVAVDQAKSHPNVGLLSAVDKFFEWVNGVIGY